MGSLGDSRVQADAFHLQINSCPFLFYIELIVIITSILANANQGKAITGIANCQQHKAKKSLGFMKQGSSVRWTLNSDVFAAIHEANSIFPQNLLLQQVILLVTRVVASLLSKEHCILYHTFRKLYLILQIFPYDMKMTRIVTLYQQQKIVE